MNKLIRVKRYKDDRKYPKSYKGKDFNEVKDLSELVLESLPTPKKSFEKEIWGGMYVDIDLLKNKIILMWRDSEIIEFSLDKIILFDLDILWENLKTDDYRDLPELKKLEKMVSLLNKLIILIKEGPKEGT